jgi:hypothetical protein
MMFRKLKKIDSHYNVHSNKRKSLKIGVFFWGGGGKLFGNFRLNVFGYVIELFLLITQFMHRMIKKFKKL